MSVDVPPLGTRRARRVVGLSGMVLAVALLVGAFIGGFALFGATGGGEPALSVRGVVTSVSADGATIGFVLDGGDPAGETLTVDVAAWTDSTGQHFEGTPSCLAPGSHGQRVELGVVDLPDVGKGPSKIVVWVHC